MIKQSVLFYYINHKIMESKSNKKSKAKVISEKYKFSHLETFTKVQLISKIKEFYNSYLQLEKKEAKYERLIKHKDMLIANQLEKLAMYNGKSDSLQKFASYNCNWLYLDKIIFIIERSNNPLTSNQITELMIKLEPSLTQRLANPFKSITKAIYSGIKFNRLVRHTKIGNFGWTYKLID